MGKRLIHTHAHAVTHTPNTQTHTHPKHTHTHQTHMHMHTQQTCTCTPTHTLHTHVHTPCIPYSKLSFSWEPWQKWQQGSCELQLYLLPHSSPSSLPTHSLCWLWAHSRYHPHWAPPGLQHHCQRSVGNKCTFNCCWLKSIIDPVQKRVCKPYKMEGLYSQSYLVRFLLSGIFPVNRASLCHHEEGNHNACKVHVYAARNIIVYTTKCNSSLHF